MHFILWIIAVKNVCLIWTNIFSKDFHILLHMSRLGYILKFLFSAFQKLPIISKSSLQMIKIIFIAVLGLHQKVLCFWNGCWCNGDCVTSLVGWLHSLLLPLPRTLTTTHRSAVLPSPLISCNHLIMQRWGKQSLMFTCVFICVWGLLMIFKLKKWCQLKFSLCFFWEKRYKLGIFKGLKSS